MGDVVDLGARRAERSPSLEGPAKCLDCQHRWIAVAPHDQERGELKWLECPACSLMRGRFIYDIALPEGWPRWVCNCGCDLMFIGDNWVRCGNCGKTQTFDNWKST